MAVAPTSLEGTPVCGTMVAVHDASICDRAACIGVSVPDTQLRSLARVNAQQIVWLGQADRCILEQATSRLRVPVWCEIWHACAFAKQDSVQHPARGMR